jgi:SAM-dependent methyltransferase
VLELGCAHGAFVGLLRGAGFDAVGLELSPWVASFAHRAFGIPMLQGLIENQVLERGAFDVLVLNDLLEHLPDPVRTIGRCVDLLRPDGLLVLQTPCFPVGLTYENLLAGRVPFLEMMSEKIAREHIYLFSRESVARLLASLGLPVLQLEPPAFIYDMYVFAGRVPRFLNCDAAIRGALQATPTGRLVESHLEAVQQMEQYRGEAYNMRHGLQALHAEYQNLERMARNLDAERNRLEAELRERETDRDHLLGRLEDRQDLGPTAIRITRALTRAGRSFPRLASLVKRVMRRG